MTDLAYLLAPCAQCPHDYGDHGEPTLTDQSCGECDCERFTAQGGTNAPQDDTRKEQ
jgi:hypothetical protein